MYDVSAMEPMWQGNYALKYPDIQKSRYTDIQIYRYTAFREKSDVWYSAVLGVLYHNLNGSDETVQSAHKLLRSYTSNTVLKTLQAILYLATRTPLRSWQSSKRGDEEPIYLHITHIQPSGVWL